MFAGGVLKEYKMWVHSHPLETTHNILNTYINDPNNRHGPSLAACVCSKSNSDPPTPKINHNYKLSIVQIHQFSKQRHACSQSKLDPSPSLHFCTIPPHSHKMVLEVKLKADTSILRKEECVLVT